MSTIEATHGWLQSTLSADQTQRRAAEEALKQSEFAAEHVVHLFRIAADTSVPVDVALRQAAAIRMKTVISRGWDSADGKLLRGLLRANEELRTLSVAGVDVLPLILPPREHADVEESTASGRLFCPMTGRPHPRK